jgi:hypothetical protein
MSKASSTKFAVEALKGLCARNPAASKAQILSRFWDLARNDKRMLRSAMRKQFKPFVEEIYEQVRVD